MPSSMLMPDSARVKFEPGWEREGTAAAPPLFAEHKVKQEAVTAPEPAQPSDALLAEKTDHTVKQECSDTESEGYNDSDSLYVSSECSGEFLLDEFLPKEEIPTDDSDHETFTPPPPHTKTPLLPHTTPPLPSHTTPRQPHTRQASFSSDCSGEFLLDEPLPKKEIQTDNSDQITSRPHTPHATTPPPPPLISPHTTPPLPPPPPHTSQASAILPKKEIQTDNLDHETFTPHTLRTTTPPPPHTTPPLPPHSTPRQPHTRQASVSSDCSGEFLLDEPLPKKEIQTDNIDQITSRPHTTTPPPSPTSPHTTPPLPPPPPHTSQASALLPTKEIQTNNSDQITSRPHTPHATTPPPPPLISPHTTPPLPPPPPHTSQASAILPKKEIQTDNLDHETFTPHTLRTTTPPPPHTTPPLPPHSTPRQPHTRQASVSSDCSGEFLLDEPLPKKEIQTDNIDQITSRPHTTTPPPSPTSPHTTPPLPPPPPHTSQASALLPTKEIQTNNLDHETFTPHTLRTTAPPPPHTTPSAPPRPHTPQASASSDGSGESLLGESLPKKIQTDNSDHGAFTPQIPAPLRPHTVPSPPPPSEQRLHDATTSPLPHKEGITPCIVRIETDPVVELMCKLLRKQEKAFTCDSCGKLYKIEAYLINHFKRCHKRIGKRLERRNRSEVTKTGKYVCAICHAQYSRIAELNKHMTYCLRRMKEQEQLYICDICSNRYKVRKNLIAHIEKCTQLRENPKSEFKKLPKKMIYSCRSCPKRFPTKSLRRVHNRIHHTGERPYQCQVCGKSFNQDSCLKRHKVTHQFHEEKIVHTCDHCGKQFAYKTDVIKHMVVHTNIRTSACDTCGRKFADAKHLRRHMLSHFPETAEKTYPCEVCKKTFLERSNLLVHMRVHTGEKPYACKVCSTKFAYMTSLKRHEAIHANDVGPFRCRTCKKLFNSKKRLIIHEQAKHTHRNGPFRCHHCKKLFNSKKLLNNHVRHHIWEPDQPLPKYGYERLDCSVRLERLPGSGIKK